METLMTTNEIKKDKAIDKIIKIFWVFLIGSMIGYLVENIVGFVQNGHFVSRQGLLFGPFIQVYGIGLIIYYLIIPHAKTNMQIFVGSMILGGVTEYLFSYFQERFFGTVSWDYSNLLFNINGRTSLLHCIYWGIGGILFMKLIYPNIEKIGRQSNKVYFKVATFILVVFMVFNISASSLAAQRSLERRQNIAPKGGLGYFFDTYYPDEKMNKIYSNSRER